MISSSKSEQNKIQIETDNDFLNSAALIVFNDDINDFEYVIKCFIEVCKLSVDIAIAKTYYIHKNEMDIVNQGEYEEMNRQKNELLKRGLKATVQTGSSN